jgi:hypothetical protein
LLAYGIFAGAHEIAQGIVDGIGDAYGGQLETPSCPCRGLRSSLALWLSHLLQP